MVQWLKCVCESQENYLLILDWSLTCVWPCDSHFPTDGFAIFLFGKKGGYKCQVWGVAVSWFMSGRKARVWDPDGRLFREVQGVRQVLGQSKSA